MQRSSAQTADVPFSIRKDRTMSNPAFKFDHVHIISETPKASADWYVEMFGATIAADTIARGAPRKSSSSSAA
jgi:hypothetical protein